jgi:hypothetical protein
MRPPTGNDTLEVRLAYFRKRRAGHFSGWGHTTLRAIFQLDTPALEYHDLVERAGFEPATSAVRGQRSPS